MSSHVLVAYDDSPEADRALAFALEEFEGARLTLLTVVDPVDASSSTRFSLPPLGDEWLERAREDAEAGLADASERAAAADRDVDTVTEVGRPASTVVEYADANDVDHVVMGSHGRSGVTRILLGSVAETVVRRSPVPVTVVRGDRATDGAVENAGADAEDASDGAGGDVPGEGSA